MAKQLVNPLERHVEKLIVAVAAVLLIGSVVRYGVTSPNRIELGGEEVTPNTIDDRVAAKASTIRERVRSAPVQVEQPTPLLDQFVTSLSPLDTELLPWVAPMRPEPPLVDRPETPVGRKELVKAVVPDAPALTAGRSTIERVAQSGAVSYPVLDWITVTALFNVKHQADVQKLAYGAQYGDVIFGPFEAQRRVRRPDGSWNDADWVDVTPSPTAPPPPLPLPAVALEQEGERVVVPKATQSAIQTYYERLSQSTRQLDLLRPLMFQIHNGSQWRFAMLTAYDDVLKQDDQYLYPDQLPTPFPEDRYGLREKATNAPTGRVQTIAQQLDAIQRMMKEAKDQCAPNLAIDAYNAAFDLAKSTDASPTERQRAAQLKAEADQLSNDIARLLRSGGCKKVEVTAAAGGKVKRTPLPVQQFWLHDAAPDSVTPGKTYQYRVRANVFNELAGDATKFADPEDATRLFVASDWSEPSEPLTVAPRAEFWVTADDAKKEEIRIELFQWSDGVWVKDTFKFGVGDEVRGESRQKIPSFNDPTVPDNALIRFNASAVVVGLDFQRSVREHKRGKSRQGFVIGPPQPGCTAAFVDEDGRMFERQVLVDKADPGKRAAGERVDLGEQIWRGGK